MATSTAVLRRRTEPPVRWWRREDCAQDSTQVVPGAAPRQSERRASPEGGMAGHLDSEEQTRRCGRTL